MDALVRLFEELGGTVRLNTEVAEILTTQGRATGVRLASGETLSADIVVCNADVASAYANLLPPAVRRKYTDRRLARMRYSMSLVVIYFGTGRQYRDGDGRPLAHHNIIVGPRYRELLSDIFTTKVLADDFSLYLHMPTLTDPTLAPPGCDTFYVLAPVPHLGGKTDWDVAAEP